MLDDVGDTDALADYKICTRAVSDYFNNVRFRYFRFKNKVINLDNSLIMRISNIEFFGTVDPTPFRQTCNYRRRNNLYLFGLLLLYRS